MKFDDFWLEARRQFQAKSQMNWRVTSSGDSKKLLRNH